MKKVVLIKIGGSVITDKTVAYSAKEEAIDSFAQDFKKLQLMNPDIQYIIGNGAGSFAHYSAKKYAISGGILSDTHRKGVCIVQNDVATLNRMVINALLKNNVDAVTIPPSSICTCAGGNIESLYLDSLLGFMSTSIVPVVHGDIVFDSIKGCAIVSTEGILGVLAKQIQKNAEYTLNEIVFVTSSGGIRDLNNKIIPIIDATNIEIVMGYITDVNGHDVTGGMKHKLQEAYELSKLCPVRVVAGVSDEKGSLILA